VVFGTCVGAWGATLGRGWSSSLHVGGMCSLRFPYATPVLITHDRVRRSGKIVAGEELGVATERTTDMYNHRCAKGCDGSMCLPMWSHRADTRS
jgi:hypothetical protein